MLELIELKLGTSTELTFCWRNKGKKAEAYTYMPPGVSRMAIKFMLHKINLDNDLCFFGIIFSWCRNLILYSVTAFCSINDFFNGIAHCVQVQKMVL